MSTYTAQNTHGQNTFPTHDYPSVVGSSSLSFGSTNLIENDVSHDSLLEMSVQTVMERHTETYLTNCRVVEDKDSKT